MSSSQIKISESSRFSLPGKIPDPLDNAVDSLDVLLDLIQDPSSCARSGEFFFVAEHINEEVDSLQRVPDLMGDPPCRVVPVKRAGPHGTIASPCSCFQ